MKPVWSASVTVGRATSSLPAGTLTKILTCEFNKDGPIRSAVLRILTLFSYEHYVSLIKSCWKTAGFKGLLWQTFKAFVRGCTISFQYSWKKCNNLEWTQFEEQIQKLDAENAARSSIKLHNEIAAFKYQLNQVLSKKNIKNIYTVKQAYFKFLNKPHKLLARQLHKGEGDRTIRWIKLESGTVVTSHNDISDTFWLFY